MAYTLGFFFADGSLTVGNRKNYYIAFHSAERHILFHIRKALNSNHKIAKRSVRSGEVYRLQIGSKEIVHDLFKLGLTLSKTKRMCIPQIPEKFFGDFVRGYFDGDGNVWSGIGNKRRKKPTKLIQVCFTSGCMSFLEELYRQLHKRGVMGGTIYSVKNKNCWRLGFSTLDALKLYEIMYNIPSKLALKRKKIIFEQFAKMRP